MADAVRGARAMNFAGFNCSLPHKVAVIQHLDGLGESAAIMGAVNCVVRRDGQYIGGGRISARAGRRSDAAHQGATISQMNLVERIGRHH